VRLGSWVTTLATRPAPSRTAVPSSAAVRVAVKSGNALRKVATTMCLTEKSSDEWTGSVVQVPAGSAVVLWCATLIGIRSPCRYY
jgi:hypothetical protein